MSALAHAIALRQNGDSAQARRILTELLARHPDNPELHYHTAWCCDNQGDEHAAIPHYRAAIDLDLNDTDLPHAYLGLGSSHRALGQYHDAAAVFNEALTRFPAHRGLQTFYAMTLYNLGDHRQCTALLLELLADTSQDPDITAYARAIRHYAQHLDDKTA